MAHTPLHRAVLALSLVGAALIAVSARAETLLYATDFEAPVFSLGPVGDNYYDPTSGQDGWLSSPRAPYSADPSPWVVVSDARAASGSQALQLVMDSSYYNGVSAYGTSAMREFGPEGLALNSATDAFSVSMSVYLDQLPASDLSWGFGLYTGVTGLGVTLAPGDKVLYGHNLMNQGLTFTPGFSLINTWLRLTLQQDPSDYTALLLTIDNGSQSWQQQLTSPGGAMARFAFGGTTPNFPVTPFAAYGTATLDDVRIGYNLVSAVPEPQTWAMWLAGAGLLLAVRRARV